MTAATTTRLLMFAGAPATAWAFGIRIWIAVVVALAASFWLELEAPSSAAITVAILAAPTRGQALDKACYRLIATLIGVTAAIAITALFSQSRDLLLAAFAGWIGLCVYAAGLLDGNRAYAAVLSGYSVALAAIQQIDTPEHVFESGMSRGAAIAIGVAAITVVNDFLAAPDSFPLLASRLAALHRRVRDYASSALTGEANEAVTAAGLLSDIAALRPEMTSLVLESASGSIRSAAARSAAVALVAQVHAARALNALPATADPAFRCVLAATLGQNSVPALDRSVSDPDFGEPRHLSARVNWARSEFLRRDAEVREALAALTAGRRPRQARRTPLHRSQPIALMAGIRAAVCLALLSAFFVMAGWPAADGSLSIVAVLIGLGALKPDPTGFTVAAFIATPIVAVLAGTLEFLILDGVNEFELLALALAPFTIGAAVLMTVPNRMVSSLAGLNLIFILVIFAPSNPPSYNPQAFLFSSLFLGVATTLLLTAQVLVPAASSERRFRWLIASARRAVDDALSRSDRHLAPEEAMFRDATRIGQIMAARSGPRDNAAIVETLSYFDRAAAIRLCRAKLDRLAGTSHSHLAAGAREALAAQDAQRLRDLAATLNDLPGAEGSLAKEISGELTLAAIVIDCQAHTAEPAREIVS